MATPKKKSPRTDNVEMAKLQDALAKLKAKILLAQLPAKRTDRDKREKVERCLMAVDQRSLDSVRAYRDEILAIFGYEVEA